jgi:hypothetical protein
VLEIQLILFSLILLVQLVVQKMLYKQFVGHMQAKVVSLNKAQMKLTKIELKFSEYSSNLEILKAKINLIKRSSLKISKLKAKTKKKKDELDLGRLETEEREINLSFDTKSRGEWKGRKRPSLLVLKRNTKKVEFSLKSPMIREYRKDSMEYFDIGLPATPRLLRKKFGKKSKFSFQGFKGKNFEKAVIQLEEELKEKVTKASDGESAVQGLSVVQKRRQIVVRNLTKKKLLKISSEDLDSQKSGNKLNSEKKINKNIEGKEDKCITELDNHGNTINAHFSTVVDKQLEIHEISPESPNASNL